MLSASPTPRTSPPTCRGSWPATPAATPTGTADPTPGTRPSYRHSQLDKYFFASLSNIFSSQLYQIFLAIWFLATLLNIFSKLHSYIFSNITTPCGRPWAEPLLVQCGRSRRSCSWLRAALTSPGPTWSPALTAGSRCGVTSYQKYIIR